MGNWTLAVLPNHYVTSASEPEARFGRSFPIADAGGAAARGGHLFKDGTARMRASYSARWRVVLVSGLAD
jgi:hypothetical protein